MSETNTQSNLLNVALKKLEIGMKAIVQFDNIDEVHTFVTAVIEKFPDALKGNYPEFNFFSATTNKFETRDKRRVADILNDLPATIYFENTEDIQRFAFAYNKENGDEPLQKTIAENNGAAKNKQYKVNSKVEDYVDEVAGSVKNAFTVVGGIQIAGGLLGGLYLLVEGDALSILGLALILMDVVLGVVLILLGKYLWAFTKMIINMSRNLFRIDSRLSNQWEIK